MNQLVIIVAFLLVIAHSAHADERNEPWAKGVSESDRARANEIFAEGNRLFAQQAHAPALAKYEEAIAIWDHPVIRFNMTVTLIRLDRMLEAAESMEATLRFGQAPFTAETYAQVTDYQNLVRGRVGEIEATCTQESARVLLDGKEWFACPATRKQRVLVGEHTVQGEHPTLFARPRRLNVSGGAVTHVQVELASVDDQFTTTRRFPRWMPWTVVGTSALTFAFGVLLQFDAANQLNQYDQDVAAACAVNGCELDTELNADGSNQAEVLLANRLNDQRDRGHRGNRIAIGVMSTAGLGIVVGLVLVVMNSPRRTPVVHATASTDGVDASLQWSF